MNGSTPFDIGWTQSRQTTLIDRVQQLHYFLLCFVSKMISVKWVTTKYSQFSSYLSASYSQLEIGCLVLLSDEEIACHLFKKNHQFLLINLFAFWTNRGIFDHYAKRSRVDCSCLFVNHHNCSRVRFPCKRAARPYILKIHVVTYTTNFTYILLLVLVLYSILWLCFSFNSRLMSILSSCTRLHSRQTQMYS